MYTLKEMLRPGGAKLAAALVAALVHVAALFSVPAFGFSEALSAFGGSQFAAIFALNLFLNACAYYLFFSALIGIKGSLAKPVSYRTLVAALFLLAVFNPFSLYMLGKSLTPPAPAPASTTGEEVPSCGLEVVSFAEFSQAPGAGMNVGDIVTGVDKDVAGSVDDILNNTKTKRPGDLTRLITRRGIFRVEVVSDPETGGPVLGIKFRAVACAATDNVPVEYTNSDYGFRFSLPDGWRDYTIVEEAWEGYHQGEQGQIPAAHGPLLLIRHPQWKAENPRQDIPIMVFTMEEWGDLRDEILHVGAAPIGPGELGRNDRYVFALPARYNYAFLPGYEEVETILAGNPLRAF